MTIGTETLPPRRRKLRVLVITMGSDRREQIKAMFAHPSMARHFDPPSFTPGIPSRHLRNRLNLLRTANDAGILPKEEWDAIGTRGVELYNDHPDTIFDCLEDVPVAPGRRGSAKDRSLHYSVELWRKAKGLNRGRSVLGCFFAHLIAMRRLVEEGYDMILEDNVRALVGRPGSSIGGEVDDDSATYCECAHRIWQTTDASDAFANSSGKCHLRYYGWLGSRANLEWVLRSHAERTAYRPDPPGGDVDSARHSGTVFPFPLKSEFNRDVPRDEEKRDGEAKCRDEVEDEVEDEDEDEDETAEAAAAAAATATAATGSKSSGTPIWGAYAYWISRTGLETLLAELRNDVGSIVWRGRRMRNYVCKPIDKVVPRKLTHVLGGGCVHVTTVPAFFRAPMLTSTIHAQWDHRFCESTEYQMTECDGGRLGWNDLWLSEEEREVVRHRKRAGAWLTLSQLSSMKDNGAKRAVSELTERMESVKVENGTEDIS